MPGQLPPIHGAGETAGAQTKDEIGRTIDPGRSPLDAAGAASLARDPAIVAGMAQSIDEWAGRIATTLDGLR